MALATYGNVIEELAGHGLDDGQVIELMARDQLRLCSATTAATPLRSSLRSETEEARCDIRDLQNQDFVPARRGKGNRRRHAPVSVLSRANRSRAARSTRRR
jgi:hypothetical protein